MTHNIPSPFDPFQRSAMEATLASRSTTEGVMQVHKLTTATHLEPAGHLTFEPIDAAIPLVMTTSAEGWERWARLEFALTRAILPILNASDIELERQIAAHPNPAEEEEGLMTITEACAEFVDRHKAGLNVMNAAMARLIITLERRNEQLAGSVS